MNLIILYPHI